MLVRCFDLMSWHLQSDTCVSTVGSTVSDVDSADSVCHIVSESRFLDTLRAFVTGPAPHLQPDIN